MSRWDRCLDISGEYTEVWCVPHRHTHTHIKDGIKFSVSRCPIGYFEKRPRGNREVCIVIENCSQGINRFPLQPKHYQAVLLFFA